MVDSVNKLSVAAVGELLREVARMHVRLQRATLDCCGGGVTEAECHVLLELGRSGRLPITELARRLGFDKGFASRVIAGLVRQRLLRRVPGPKDRRVVEVGLTRRGEAKRKAFNRAVAKQATQLLSSVGPGELLVVQRGLSILEGTLKANLAPTQRRSTRDAEDDP